MNDQQLVSQEAIDLIRAVITWRHSVLDSDADIDRLIEAVDAYEAKHGTP